MMPMANRERTNSQTRPAPIILIEEMVSPSLSDDSDRRPNTARRSRLVPSTSVFRTSSTLDESSLTPNIMLSKYEGKLEQVILLQSCIRRYRTYRAVRTYVKNQSARKNIVEEIVSTEKTYISQLYQFRAIFCAKLKRIQSSIDIQGLDSEIQIIVSYSELLLGQLAERVSNWENGQTQIGDIFIAYCDFLKTYSQYISLHESLRFAIQKEKTENESFRKTIAKCETEAENQSLNTFLILPIQRLPRYEMLLHTLLDRTVWFHEDFHNLEIALKKMKKVTSYVDEREKQHEDIRKVLAIQGSITGKFPWIPLPHRKFIKEGLVTRFPIMKKRYWFLLNDIIVSTKPHSTNSQSKTKAMKHQYRFEAILPLDQILSVQCGDGNAWCTVVITQKKSGQTSWSLSLPTVAEAISWKDAIFSAKQKWEHSSSTITTAPTQTKKKKKLRRSTSKRLSIQFRLPSPKPKRAEEDPGFISSSSSKKKITGNTLAIPITL